MTKRFLFFFAMMAVMSAVACGDDAADSNTDATPDMSPEATPDMSPEATPDMSPEATPDMNPDPSPDNGEDIEECQAVCATVFECPAIVELCSEETLATVLEGCEEVCESDETIRAQILAASELDCAQTDPLVIDSFDLNNICGEEAAPLSRGLALFNDYATGSEVALVEFNDLEIITETVLTSDSTDAKIQRVSETEFAFIDRIVNEVTLYEIVEGEQEEGVSIVEVGSAPTGEASNPQAMVRVGDRYMVTRYGLPGLLVLDEDLEEVGTIDLDEVNVEDLEDGVPEMAQAFDLGDGFGAVFLQNLNNFATVGDSFLVIVDLENVELVSQIGLPGGNPFFVLQEPNGFLVALIDNFGDVTGQVVRVDFEADTITRGIILEEEVGGDILSLAPVTDGFLVVVANPDFTTKLVHFFNDEANTVLQSVGYDLGTATFIAATNQVVVTTAAADGTGMLFFDADELSIDTAEGPFTHGELPLREFISID
jgi:hypothetical protein